jgi:hypothetical protein
MFNFKSIVEQVATASKTPLTYVEDKGIRANLETLVDSYADFTVSLYDTSLGLSKQVVESAKKVDYTKFFAAK